MRYRRARVAGGSYFFTLVTFSRAKILCEPENIDLLRRAFKYVMERHPFTIDAHVILPDHLHFLWTLPDGDADFSTRWRLIKSYFTKNCHTKYKNNRSRVRKTKKEQTIWQRRFWEHMIRDDRDFTNHVEYIHHNPVKHGLTKSPRDWQHSSFHRYVRDGLYDADWAATEPIEFDENIAGE